MILKFATCYRFRFFKLKNLLIDFKYLNRLIPSCKIFISFVKRKLYSQSQPTVNLGFLLFLV